MACYHDLEQAYEYIRADSPRYAKSFAQAVLNRARWLKANADLCASVPEFAEEHLREALVGRYRLIFARREREIILLGLIHGARDLPTLWLREQRPR